MSACGHDLPDDWTDEQRALFDRVCRHIGENQRAFTHPDAPQLPLEQWSTTAWNAAWFAAHCAGPDPRPCVHVQEGDDGDSEVIAAEVTNRTVN